MSSLSSLEKRIFEDLFKLGSGYVLSFSNSDFAEFFRECVGMDIYNQKYAFVGDSKAKRLRAFWELEADPAVGKVLSALLDMWDYENPNTVDDEKDRYERARSIAKRLQEPVNTNNSENSMNALDAIGAGDVIDGKYRVTDKFRRSGGMGTVVHVIPLQQNAPFDIVLKYLHKDTEECRDRFIREVEQLRKYVGNSKIIQLHSDNLNFHPPYFTTKYYSMGDLQKYVPEISKSYSKQKYVINQMIDCISQLHNRNELHRDIKPANFLVDEDGLAVADFGLMKRIESEAKLTRSSATWGTGGYIPPEIKKSGLRAATVQSDIYMLGKTIFEIVSGIDPEYFNDESISPVLYPILDKCCKFMPNNRYQSLHELAIDIDKAYNVLLVSNGNSQRTMSSSVSGDPQMYLSPSRRSVDDVHALLTFVLQGELGEQWRLCKSLDSSFFQVIASGNFNMSLPAFVGIYEKMVEQFDYAYEYAETIASNLEILFTSEQIPIAIRTDALRIAMNAALEKNRYAAMDTCKMMIKEVRNQELGLSISQMLLAIKPWFLEDMDPSELNDISNSEVQTACMFLMKNKNLE